MYYGNSYQAHQYFFANLEICYHFVHNLVSRDFLLILEKSGVHLELAQRTDLFNCIVDFLSCKRANETYVVKLTNNFSSYSDLKRFTFDAWLLTDFGAYLSPK